MALSECRLEEVGRELLGSALASGVGLLGKDPGVTGWESGIGHEDTLQKPWNMGEMPPQLKRWDVKGWAVRDAVT